MEKKVPQRMCIACRQMKPKKELIRIVKSPDGNIELDFTGKKNGRGAYVCNDGECIKKLRKQKLINRVFSCEAKEEVYQKIEENFFDKH